MSREIPWNGSKSSLIEVMNDAKSVAEGRDPEIERAVAELMKQTKEQTPFSAACIHIGIRRQNLVEARAVSF